MASPKSLVVAISGCSSSGKTTLARLLRDMIPNTCVLHQDDFYKPESELPNKHGLLDWDCAEAIDVGAMTEALAYIRLHAAFPPNLESKEDQNSVGKCPVPEPILASQREKVLSALPPRGTPRLFILDGFLLYSPSMAALQPLLDVKLFVRTSHATAKARREARDGYVTLEGFWKDPPGYVDRVVWPNYVEEHAWMFERGDVEGRYRRDVLGRAGIRVMGEDGGEDGVEVGMDKVLAWVVDVVLDEMGRAR